jgi:ATP-binding cassette subfamily B protein/subfamily B ATP-binding cassette protein MsbA
MSEEQSNPRRRFSALAVVKQVFALDTSLRAVTVLMIFIGIAAGLAEMVGITFLISLIFLIAQDPQNSASAYAWVPHYLEIAGIEPSRTVVLFVLIGAILAKLLLSLTDALLVSSVAQRISEGMRFKIYNRLLDIPFKDIHHRDRGELITILATESYSVANAHRSIVRIGVNVGTLGIFGAALIGTAWQIAIVAFLAGIAHTLLMKLFARPYSRLGANVSSALEKLTRLEWTTLQTLKAVRSFGLENTQRALFADLSHTVRRLLLRSDQLGHITSVLSETLIFLVLLAVMLLSGRLGLAFPAVLASTVLIYRVQPHIRELDLQLLKLLELETPVQRCAELIDETSDGDPELGHLPVNDLKSGIEFRNVSFAYPGAARNCLDGKNLLIPAGGKIGIIGPSGSGKTTIMNLVLGLTTPNSGQVLVDGVPLGDVRREDWTKMIAVAGQDVELMEGTIRENILFFRDFSEEQMRWAAETAGATGFINDMPGGFDELVGEEAIKLSGGQRQRIGIARAIIGQQKILLLDEATSALDEETEAAVLGRILEAYKDRTVVAITHRRSVIPLLDQVINLREDYLLQVANRKEPKDA